MEKIQKALRRDRQEILSMEKFGGYKTEAKYIVEYMVMLALRTKVKEDKHFEIYGELRQDLGMETFLHGPRDYAKRLKVRFR